MPILTCECEMVWLKLLPVENGAVADVAPRDAAGFLVFLPQASGPAVEAVDTASRKVKRKERQRTL